MSGKRNDASNDGSTEFDELDHRGLIRIRLAKLERRLVESFNHGAPRDLRIKVYDEPRPGEMATKGLEFVDQASTRLNYDERRLEQICYAVHRDFGATPRERAMARVCLTLPAMWEELDPSKPASRKPSWWLVSVLAAALAEFPEEKTAQRVTSLRRSQFGAKRSAEKRKELSQPLLKKIHGMANLHLGSGTKVHWIRGKIVKDLAREGLVYSPWQVLRYLKVHPSGHWPTRKQQPPKRK